MADITYIGNRKKPSYLSLITDSYSKKTVDQYLADNLNMERSLMALKKVLKSNKIDRK